MTVQYGAGTDPLTLDTAKFEFIDHAHAEALDLQEISDGNGDPLQDDARERKDTKNLQYYCLTATPEADAPATGATASGYLVLSRDVKRNQKGHNILTLTIRNRVAVDVTVSYPLT